MNEKEFVRRRFIGTVATASEGIAASGLTPAFGSSRDTADKLAAVGGKSGTPEQALPRMAIYRRKNSRLRRENHTKQSLASNRTLLGTKSDMDDIVNGIMKVYENRDQLSKKFNQKYQFTVFQINFPLKFL